MTRPTANEDASGYFVFDEKVLTGLGAELHDAYANADPYPHASIDDFLPPSLVESLFEDFPPPSAEFWRKDEDGLRTRRHCLTKTWALCCGARACTRLN